MTILIPVVAPGKSADSLGEILRGVRVQGIDIGKPSSGGLAVDPGTIALIVEVAKVTLPALLSALATVWAAKISKDSSEESTSGPNRRPRLVLELDASEVSIELDASGQTVLPQQATDSLEALVRIRLES